MAITNKCKSCYALCKAIPLLLIVLTTWKMHHEIVTTKLFDPFTQCVHQDPLTKSSPTGNCSVPQQFANYSAPFISPSQWTKGEGDLYSGMWWQSIDSMMKTNYSKLTFLEAISFRSFQNNERVIQTVDWLDVSVEHLSKYVKYFSRIRIDDVLIRAVEDRLAELIEAYIERSKDVCPHQTTSSSRESAIPATIAILPLRVPSLEKHEVRFLRLQLIATLASLWAAGFPRAVVAGVSHNESLIAKESFGLLKDHLKARNMELEFVQIDTQETELVPKVSLSQFQEIIAQLRNTQENQVNNPDVTKWLGQDNSSKWRHIYFTEPDLILHIRSEAIPSLSNELKKGHIVNAHRLQPLPHMQQFHDIIAHTDPSTQEAASKLGNKVLPNQATFAAVHSLNPHAGDICCDQGKFYPSNLVDSTTPTKKGKGCWLWEFCGFSPGVNLSDWSSVVKRHELLLMHPFLSLERGTRIPLVHHGQRVCTPKQDDSICFG